jgi:SAM-dependent methyltransferase
MPDIDALAEAVSASTTLPVPTKEESQFIGDGDFLRIGASFLKLFVTLGGLEPSDRVLEIGCGIGRMGVPLTQYLDASSRYDGIDIVPHGIAWCAANVTPRWPNFQFHHLDLFHPNYNLNGKINTSNIQLPFDDGSYDFVLLTSVFTHLWPEDVQHYAAEIRRILRPGGTCFGTFFVMTPERKVELSDLATRLPFRVNRPGPSYTFNEQYPLSAIAFDEQWIINNFAVRGLQLAAPVAFGIWDKPREIQVTYQDVCIFIAV